MADATSSAPGFDDTLAALADLAVTVAVNLQQGQELIVCSPLEGAPLVRHVARVAYRRGAPAVTCVYDDPELIRERLLECSPDALDYAAPWLHRGIVQGLRAGAARLQLAGPYPDLLRDVPAERILRTHSAMAGAARDEAAQTAATAINTSVVPVVTRAWARQVFPDEAEPEACRALWEALFSATRLSVPDPRTAWNTHIRAINARRDELQARRFASLRFYDGTTDLTVGLAQDHCWRGGSRIGANGIEGVPDIPTEEVFTALDGRLTTGHVLFSRPLALGGTMVRNLYVRFAAGTLTTVRADEGGEMFERLIASEEGRRLGEVGLAPGSSPLARSGILFCNPLLDRNAASHVAFGPSPADGRHEWPADHGETNAATGGAVHIDCTLGHRSMQVDGRTRTGALVPVMRDGEFVT